MHSRVKAFVRVRFWPASPNTAGDDQLGCRAIPSGRNRLISGLTVFHHAALIPVRSSEHIAKSVLIRIASATIHFTGQGQLLWVGVCLRHTFGRRFSLVSMVSINLGIWFYEVETGDTGESIEPEESH